MSSATSRTVLGPRVQSTRRIASSASVGLRRIAFGTRRIIYEAFRRCQYEKVRRHKGHKGWRQRHKGHEDGEGYSRSAVSGSTRVARDEGTATATAATSARSTETAV